MKIVEINPVFKRFDKISKDNYRVAPPPPHYKYFIF